MRKVLSLFIIGIFVASASAATAQTKGATVAKAAENKTDNKANGDSAAAPKSAELEKLEDAPEEGVDADIQLAFDRANKALNAGNPEKASWIMRSTYLTSDRFTKAQRDQKKDEAVEILREAGQQMAGRGDYSSAASAYDAAWLLSDKTESGRYAKLLVRWAKKKEDNKPGQALYMARRAKRVDPSFDAANRLDTRLSENKNKTTGRAVQIGGAAVALGGFAAMFLVDKPGLQRTSLYIGLGGLGIAGLGSYIFAAGVPNYRPVSPDVLPALPNRGKK